MLLCVAAHAGQKQAAQAESPLFDMQELVDDSTLDVEVLQEWHVVKGAVPTRQKLVTILVIEMWPGQDYRCAKQSCCESAGQSSLAKG
jgi:hypothetical protein